MAVASEAVKQALELPAEQLSESQYELQKLKLNLSVWLAKGVLSLLPPVWLLLFWFFGR